jgi:hypothetical protein
MAVQPENDAEPASPGRQREVQEWNAAHPETMANPTVFEREILPAIRNVALSELVRATGLTHGYRSQIRRGRDDEVAAEPSPARCWLHRPSENLAAEPSSLR